MSARILIVDDEPAICEMIAFTLEGESIAYDIAGSVTEARRLLTEHNPDLVLLDWMLPGQSGIEYARELKRDKATAEVPVIMITARTEEHHVVGGLDAGADDYITKPFSPKELVVRINAVLRRAAPHVAGNELSAGELALDPVSHRVSVSGEELRVGPTEFRLLQFLMSHPDRVYSRSQLIDHVWGRNVYIEERTVDVHVRRLRESLARSGCDRMIQTVRGAGYRFSARD